MRFAVVEGMGEYNNTLNTFNQFKSNVASQFKVDTNQEESSKAKVQEGFFYEQKIKLALKKLCTNQSDLETLSKLLVQPMQTALLMSEEKQEASNNNNPEVKSTLTYEREALHQNCLDFIAKIENKASNIGKLELLFSFIKDVFKNVFKDIVCTKGGTNINNVNNTDFESAISSIKTIVAEQLQKIDVSGDFKVARYQINKLKDIYIDASKFDQSIQNKPEDEATGIKKEFLKAEFFQDYPLFKKLLELEEKKEDRTLSDNVKKDIENLISSDLKEAIHLDNEVARLKKQDSDLNVETLSEKLALKIELKTCQLETKLIIFVEKTKQLFKNTETGDTVNQENLSQGGTKKDQEVTLLSVAEKLETFLKKIDEGGKEFENYLENRKASLLGINALKGLMSAESGITQAKNKITNDNQGLKKIQKENKGIIKKLNTQVKQQMKIIDGLLARNEKNIEDEVNANTEKQ